MFSGGTRLDDIAAGRSDIATRTYERAMRWFSLHWPDGVAWPADIERPPVEDSAGAGKITVGGE